MAEQAGAIIPEQSASPPAAGIFPYQAIKELIRSGEVRAAAEISDAQIQPASLDLRLGAVAYRVRASFMPGSGATVADKIGQLGMHEIDLTTGAVLEKGCVYIVPLMEHLRLGGAIAGLANPKSSIGRLDVFTRLIADHATEFERVKAGYQGPLYLEIFPRTFSIVVRTGSKLNQLRFRRGSPDSSAAQLRRLHHEVGLVDRALSEDALAGGGVPLSVDLTDPEDGALVGYRARPNTGLIDVDRTGYYEAGDYWEPISADGRRAIVLNPDDFYILASKEAVTVPPDHVAEMMPYDPLVGEFRVHYAGFFDPGFGYGPDGGGGTRAVLEVRSHGVPFAIEDGQTVGRLIYEKLTDTPDRLYGPAIGSSYQNQGLNLSKHFKPRR
jgi:dCTP deaminase